MSTEKKAVDWERIEVDYRAGVLSLREVGGQHGVTEGAIRKRAKRDEWVRDLSAKVQAKADDLVRKAEVRKSVRTECVVTERIVIEANAQRIAAVRGEHRADIGRMRALVLRLLEECEAEAAEPGLFAGLGKIMANPDESGRDKARDAYEKAISLPQRIRGVKELAEALRVLVAMEREAYGITTGFVSEGEDAHGEVMRRMAQARRSGVKTTLTPGSVLGLEAEDIDVN